MTVTNPRPTLDGEHFDIVVIGGGINGAAIARECARAGKRVFVVEQHDFASGTTSRATRIIHGGLRYLEHGEIGLVRESLREREWLLRQHPNLVRPLNFLLAMPQGSRRSALEIRFGLWLYRRFAHHNGVQQAKEDRRRLEQLLDNGQRWSVFAYEDAQCEYPERLVIEWIMEAIASSAVARNHTEALEVIRTNKTITGVSLRERQTQREYDVTAKWVINATGPWADYICSRSSINTDEPLIGGVRGSHILLPTFNGAPQSAIYTEATDGRPIFVVPWAGQLLVGTTEVKDQDDPAKATPHADEINYLVQSFRRLFPKIEYGLSDIRAAFAGIRPLPFLNDKSPSAITRRHFIVDHADDEALGMISVIGGKLTTAMSLAREVARAVGIAVPERQDYAVVPIDNHDPPTQTEQWFGPAAQAISQLARSSDVFGQPLCEGSQHTVAEAVHAFRNECAGTLADVLLRRVPVTFECSWTAESSIAAAHRIGSALGWTATETAQQLEGLNREYDQFLRKP